MNTNVKGDIVLEGTENGHAHTCKHPHAHTDTQPTLRHTHLMTFHTPENETRYTTGHMHIK